MSWITYHRVKAINEDVQFSTMQGIDYQTVKVYKTDTTVNNWIDDTTVRLPAGNYHNPDGWEIDAYAHREIPDAPQHHRMTGAIPEIPPQALDKRCHILEDHRYQPDWIDRPFEYVHDEWTQFADTDIIPNKCTQCQTSIPDMDPILLSNHSKRPTGNGILCPACTHKNDVASGLTCHSCGVYVQQIANVKYHDVRLCRSCAVRPMPIQITPKPFWLELKWLVIDFPICQMKN